MEQANVNAAPLQGCAFDLRPRLQSTGFIRPLPPSPPAPSFFVKDPAVLRERVGDQVPIAKQEPKGLDAHADTSNRPAIALVEL